MYLSPPITVLAILAAGLAATAWHAPLQHASEQVTMKLPTATHQKLALWGNKHTSADGRPLTVAQVIEVLVDKLEKDIEGPAN